MSCRRSMRVLKEWTKRPKMNSVRLLINKLLVCETLDKHLVFRRKQSNALVAMLDGLWCVLSDAKSGPHSPRKEKPLQTCGASERAGSVDAQTRSAQGRPKSTYRI